MSVSVKQAPVSPADYYRMTELTEREELFSIKELFPLVINGQYPLSVMDTDELEERVVFSESISSYSMWRVSTWWFAGKPFAVELRTTKPNKSKVIITNESRYLVAEMSIRMLLTGPIQAHKEDEPMPEISEFGERHVRDIISLNEDGSILPKEANFSVGDTISFPVYSMGGKPMVIFLKGEVKSVSCPTKIPKVYFVKVIGLSSRQTTKDSRNLEFAQSVLEQKLPFDIEVNETERVALESSTMA